MARPIAAKPSDEAHAVPPRSVDVYLSIDTDDVVVGRLYPHVGRGVESATFAYDPTYLADPRAYALEPALPLDASPHHTDAGLPMFRSFADTAPDRWGRRLILRTERLRAEQRHTPARALSEFAFVLGVRDDLRQGALRFRAIDSGTFMAEDDSGVPTLTELPALLALARRAELEDAPLEELRSLLRAGSSLGGARPKTHVRAPDGHVAIAKFPSESADSWNVMAWEKTTLDLAGMAGVSVPLNVLLNIAGRHVLVVDRFDRYNDRRIGYVSALTMLEARDGDIGTYLDIAAAVEEHSPATTDDLHQLWRRMAFTVLVSNTDDHLREADANGSAPAYERLCYNPS